MLEQCVIITKPLFDFLAERNWQDDRTVPYADRVQSVECCQQQSVRQHHIKCFIPTHRYTATSVQDRITSSVLYDMHTYSNQSVRWNHIKCLILTCTHTATSL